MNNIIKNFKTEELKDTKFVHPLKITYNQNGINKSWEAVQSSDSVAVLLYHEDKNAFVLVKQFRPPVYLNEKKHLNTYELCAGIVDKNESSIKLFKSINFKEEGKLIKHFFVNQKNSKPSHVKKDEIIDSYRVQMINLNEKYKDDTATLKQQKMIFLRSASAELHKNIFFDEDEIKVIIKSLASV